MAAGASLLNQVALITGGARGGVIKSNAAGRAVAAQPGACCLLPPPPAPDTRPPRLLAHLAGIGFACAQSLGRAGAKVLVADIDADAVGQAETQLQAEGIEAFSCACDVGDKQQVACRERMY